MRIVPNLRFTIQSKKPRRNYQLEQTPLFLRINKNPQGQIFIFALIILGLVTISTILLLDGSVTFLQNATLSTESLQASNLAEAGLDKAVASLNVSGGSYNGESETFLGSGSYSVSVASIDVATVLVTSTGYIPNKLKPIARKTVSIQATKGVGASFTYGMQVGNGGINMGNSSIINGSIYSNGNFTGGNSNNVYGDVYVAGTQPALDQSSQCVNPNCSDFFFGQTSSGNNIYDVAQSFKPNSNAILNKVSLYLKKIGNPPNPTVKILGDNSGKPDKNNVLAAGTLNASSATSSYGWIDITFSTTPSLNQNTPYWIVITTSSLPAYDRTNNYWSWSEDLLQTYIRGSSAWSNNWQAVSPVWTKIPADLDFQTFIGGVVNTVQLSNGSTVYGNVHANTINGSFNITKDAYYQTLSGPSVQGNKHPGSSDPAPLAFPISDANITQWKTDAQNAGVFTGDINTCPALLGPGKYVGNFNVGNSCTVTVKTPIWFTGNFLTGNSPTFNLDSSYGDSSGMIIVDGTATLGNSPSFNGVSGHPKSYMFLITTYDSRISGNPAIIIGNGSVTGVLYAPYGLVNLPNGSNMKELVAYQINMGNSTTLNYQTGLSNVFFSSGSQGSYTVIKGTYQSK